MQSSDVERLVVDESGEVSAEDEPRAPRSQRMAVVMTGIALVMAGCAFLLTSSDRKINIAPNVDFADYFELTGMATKKCYRNKSYWVEQAGAIQMPGTTRSSESSAYACQQRCASTPGCEHFSFWMDGGCLLTSYSAYSSLFEGSTKTNGVISGPRVCKVMSDLPTEELVSALDVPAFIASEAQGCNSLHDEYQLAWKAQGETFFDEWQFINKSETRGAEWYLNRSEAFYQGTVTAAEQGAILRVGEQVQPFKRRSMMLHSEQAWRPDIGFIVVLRYKHVPYGPGVWPAFWLLNSDLKWPQGGELDIMEYANYDTAKVTFHTDKKCNMSEKKLKACTKTMSDVDDSQVLSCYTNYSGNELGCMPPQVRKNGEWFSKNPGAIALVWDANGIISFHIPEAEIPADLESDTPKPNTWKDSWRMAFMPFEEKTCQNVARPQEIVLNIALCGDWASNTFFPCDECRETGYTPNYCIPGHVTEPATDCCTLYISNPTAEKPLKDHAYFDITYVKVYTPKGKVLPKYAAGTFVQNVEPHLAGGEHSVALSPLGAGPPPDMDGAGPPPEMLPTEPKLAFTSQDKVLDPKKNSAGTLRVGMQLAFLVLCSMARDF